MKILELLEKIDKQIYWQKNIGDYPCFTLNELKQIKKELEDYQFLNKLHTQMKEEMEREQKAQLELAKKNLEGYMMIDYSYCMGRASCYRDLLDYYDEDWVKENVR